MFVVILRFLAVGICSHLAPKVCSWSSRYVAYSFVCAQAVGYVPANYVEPEQSAEHEEEEHDEDGCEYADVGAYDDEEDSTPDMDEVSCNNFQRAVFVWIESALASTRPTLLGI